MDNASKLDIYEVVKVDKEAILAAYSNDVQNGWMSKEWLDYLISYPVATIYEKKQDQHNNWHYLIYFLGSDVDEAFFSEEALSSTGQFISPSKFKYLEIVKIINPSKGNKKVIYLQGTVTDLGLDIYGNWFYSVSFPQDYIRSCEENELESTGKFDKNKPFKMTNEHIKVIVHPDGRGELKK